MASPRASRNFRIRASTSLSVRPAARNESGSIGHEARSRRPLRRRRAAAGLVAASRPARSSCVDALEQLRRASGPCRRSIVVGFGGSQRGPGVDPLPAPSPASRASRLSSVECSWPIGPMSRQADVATERAANGNSSFSRGREPSNAVAGRTVSPDGQRCVRGCAGHFAGRSRPV